MTKEKLIFIDANNITNVEQIDQHRAFLIDLIKQGKDAWNAWRDKLPNSFLSLSDVDFSESGYNIKDFRGFRFGNMLFIESATFGDNTRFNKATFGNVISFKYTTFGTNITFNKATFGNKIDFSKSMFGNNIDFAEVSFGNDIDFREVTFGEVVNFRNAKFAKDSVINYIQGKKQR